MAQHASARKATRQSLKRRARNRSNNSRVRTQIKKLRLAIAGGDAAAAAGMLPATVSEIDKASKSGVLHDNAAARYKSRLTRAVQGIGAAS